MADRADELFLAGMGHLIDKYLAVQPNAGGVAGSICTTAAYALAQLLDRFPLPPDRREAFLVDVCRQIVHITEAMLRDARTEGHHN